MMDPKPTHLGKTYADQFKDSSVVDVYHYRPPYPDAVIEKLVSFITDEPRTVLDAGCGTGEIARKLVQFVEHVDAVDASRAMLEQGRTLPDGNHAHLRWIHGAIEEVPLYPPYALITAGERLHWMDWLTVLPLFRRILTPHGYLALVGRGTGRNPWDKDLQRLINQFSTNQEYRPYNLTEELERRHLFQVQGYLQTSAAPFVQSAEDYIHSIHSRNGFSQDRMSPDAAQGFDDEVRRLVSPFLQDGLLTFSLFGSIVWGKPLTLE